MAEGQGRLLKSQQLMNLLQVSWPVLRAWITAGMPVVELGRSKPGKKVRIHRRYELGEVLRWLKERHIAVGAPLVPGEPGTAEWIERRIHGEAEPKE